MGGPDMKKSVKIVAILTVLVMGVLTVLSACDGRRNVARNPERTL